MTTARLNVRDLSVSIGGKQVCDRLSFSVFPGDVWCVLGGNGTGKTTLLHTLAGLRRPSGGSIEINGYDLANLSPRVRAQHMGLLLQDYDDVYSVTVREVALMGRHPHMHPWQFESRGDFSRAQEAIEILGLTGLEDRQLTTLSGGERRRARIATLLVQAPSMYLLDEPSNHLDVHHQVRMLEILAQVTSSKNAATIMAVHDVNLAGRICSHAILLSGSGKTISGPFQDVVTTENLSQLYRHTIQRVQSNSRTLFFPA